MIDCWVRERCKKAVDCDGESCIKLFKINELCNLAMLTDDQRRKKKLWLDGNGIDKDAFTFLKSVEDNVEKFVNSGDNLYIYSYITGNGKTAWALRILNSYIEKIWYKSDIVCLFSPMYPPFLCVIPTIFFFLSCYETIIFVNAIIAHTHMVFFFCNINHIIVLHYCFRFLS